MTILSGQVSLNPLGHSLVDWLGSASCGNRLLVTWYREVQRVRGGQHNVLPTRLNVHGARNWTGCYSEVSLSEES